MNTKTTLVLAIVAAGVAGYLFLVEKPWEGGTQVAEEPKSVAVALFDPRPADVDRVEVERRIDGRKLVFVKNEDKSWRLVEPVETPVAEYQVTQIVNKVADIKFDVKHGPDDKLRPSEKVTGLDRPVATVRLLKGGQEAAHVVVGSRLPTGQGNYIKVGKETKTQVDGKEQVITANHVLESQADLSDAFTAKLDTLRDKNVLRFDLADVKSMTVEGDRNYVLVKSGDNWVLESPVRGRADKSKAEGIVRSLTNLYVAEFKDDAPASYVPFQLDPPRMKITVLTEKTIPAKAKPGDPDTQPADLEPTKQEIAHELLVGGELDNPSGTKQYFARLADKPWLFTLNDYTYKQLAVDLGELQDKKLASVENHRVKSIKVDTPQGSLVLSKQVGGGWHDAENVAADEVAVDDLLRAVSGLQATNYVDPATELITIDWDQPRARVTLVEEGSLNPTTLLVGPPSASGRMVFVRNAAEEAVAAVREDAVAQLLAGPMAYRDRTVLRLDRARTNRIEISQAGQETVSLVQNHGEWSMAAPAQAPVDRESVRNLMQNLASLNARQVVSDGDRAAYGLDAPAVTVAAFVEPAATEPEATEAAATEAAPATETAADEPAEGAASEPAPAADAQAATEEAVTAEPAVAEPAKPRVTKTIPERIKQIEEPLEYQKTNPNENPLATQMLREELAKLEAAATQPENQASEAPATTDAQPAPAAEPSAPVAPEGPNVQRLHLARHQGRVYAAVDGNELIYELDEQVLKDITAEMHDRQITQFESGQVLEVQFAEGQASATFRKTGEDWKYALDSVLPIDKDKVTGALDDVKELRTHRYVSYKADDLGRFGLESPARTFAVALDGGQRLELLISADGPELDPDQSVYAALAGQPKVFLLKPDQVEKLSRKLEDFEKSASASPGPSMPPGQMPQFSPAQFQ